MKTKWVEDRVKYDGSQLKSLYGYLNYEILGDAAVGWRGPCDVSEEHMVDGEDKLAGAKIAGDDMIHIIVERFSEGLSFSVAAQRLIASLTKDLLVEMISDKSLVTELRREGDDVYWNAKKFSISIATVSPVSALVHFAFNVTNEGTPVETCALSDFGIDAAEFGNKLLTKIQIELDTLLEATQKVHWVN